MPNDLGGGGADPGFQGCTIGLSLRDQWGIHSREGNLGYNLPVWNSACLLL